MGNTPLPDLGEEERVHGVEAVDDRLEALGPGVEILRLVLHAVLEERLALGGAERHVGVREDLAAAWGRGGRINMRVEPVALVRVACMRVIWVRGAGDKGGREGVGGDGGNRRCRRGRRRWPG